jgi:hypothetical protein
MFFKIIFCFFIFIVLYFIINSLFKNKTVEGLTIPDVGEGANASTYAASIKAQVVKLQDELLINKYRKDYETAIINLDDYIGYLMIKQVLNMKIDGDVKTNTDSLAILNTLKTTKESLNATMTFLDKQ